MKHINLTNLSELMNNNHNNNKQQELERRAVLTIARKLAEQNDSIIYKANKTKNKRTIIPLFIEHKRYTKIKQKKDSIYTRWKLKTRKNMLLKLHILL